MFWPAAIAGVDRNAAARYQFNVADVQDAVQPAVGGTALTQVLGGGRRDDLVLRYQPQFRTTKEVIESIRILSPSGECARGHRQDLRNDLYHLRDALTTPREYRLADKELKREHAGEGRHDPAPNHKCKLQAGSA